MAITLMEVATHTIRVVQRIIKAMVDQATRVMEAMAVMVVMAVTAIIRVLTRALITAHILATEAMLNRSMDRTEGIINSRASTSTWPISEQPAKLGHRTCVSLMVTSERPLISMTKAGQTCPDNLNK